MPDIVCGNCVRPQSPTPPPSMPELWRPWTLGAHRPVATRQALVREKAGGRKPAHASDIAALPRRRLGDQDALAEHHCCMVCLEDCGAGDVVTTLPCLHAYHKKCVDRWLHTNNSCPVCKHPIGARVRGGR